MYRVHVSLCQSGQSGWGEGGFCTPPKIGMCSLLTELWRDSDFRARSDYPLPFLVSSYQVTRILYSIHYDDDSQTICCVRSFQCLQRVSKMLCTSVSIPFIGVSTVICVVSINLPALWPPQKNWQQCRNCQCRILSSDTRRKPVEPELKAGLPISLLDATIFWSAFIEVNSQYSVQLTCSQSREKLI